MCSQKLAISSRVLPFVSGTMRQMKITHSKLVIGILLDFWHLYTSDTTPDEVAKLDKNMILGVQICDSARGDAAQLVDNGIVFSAVSLPAAAGNHNGTMGRVPRENNSSIQIGAGCFGGILQR